MEGKRKPAAFMSYAHADVEAERLSEFRKRLSQEVSEQIGEEFLIFQDKDSVQWGNNWQERIEESLDETTFFIPIITPGFFKSPHCRDELERFLERETEVGRRDLILPVYYVDYPLLNDRSRRSNDVLVYVIATRQHADWRDLKHEPINSPRVKETMAHLAAGIREALDRVQGGKKPPPRPPVEPEPLTRIVDPYGRNGTYTTIAEAIEAANPRDRILIRPGFYQERIIVDKPLEIIGDGELHEVEVQTIAESALSFSAPFGRVANLTLTALPGSGRTGEGAFGAAIHQGRLELEECDISSRETSCVRIYSGANPRLRRNRIHDGMHVGISVDGSYAHGVLEDNDIFDNEGNGVTIGEGSSLTLRRNTIHNNRGYGVDNMGGHLTLEDNDIVENGWHGVVISEGNATLRRNRINHNHLNGIRLVNSNVTIEDNDLQNNRGKAISEWLGGVFRTQTVISRRNKT